MTHRELDAERLTIYCMEADRHDGRPLYEWLLEHAHAANRAGAIVTRGLAGFGKRHRMHHQHVLALSDSLPVVVQVIDVAERIDAWLDSLGDALIGYTYIREHVRYHKPEA